MKILPLIIIRVRIRSMKVVVGSSGGGGSGSSSNNNNNVNVFIQYYRKKNHMCYVFLGSSNVIACIIIINTN